MDKTRSPGMSRAIAVGVVLLLNWLGFVTGALFFPFESAGLHFSVVLGALITSAMVFSLFVGFVLEVIGERKRNRINLVLKGRPVRAIRFALIAVSFLAMLGGTGTSLYQVLVYFWQGGWQPISALDPLVSVNWSWAITPDSLLGAWKILDWLPLSVALILAAIVILVISSALDPE